MPLRDAVQELRELGVRGAAFRAGWELRTRLPHIATRMEPPPLKIETGADWTTHLPLEDPVSLARWMRPLIPAGDIEVLRRRASDGAEGRVFCFGHRVIDFGNPIKWHRNPTTGLEWPAGASWVEALMNSAPGDVKDVWEVARFPHAYHLARSAAFFPEDAERLAEALVGQIHGFIEQNPVGLGVHWASGQEVGFRLLAWLFALDVLLLRTRAGTESAQMVRDALVVGATEIERHLDYACIAVYNNHLLSEALALFGVGALLPDYRDGIKWREMGRKILDEQAEAQFYLDGAYIQQSHNYHRVALHDYLWACIFARSMGDSPSPVWIAALERSLDFLVAQQNPADGRLPNYGANDGALPSILTTCDFADMRPTLQTVSLLVRRERLYEPGPWDESAAWFLGVRALDSPMRQPERTSVAFRETGYFTLRGNDSETFSVFRCGSLRDRFSQIDMLHLDVWWKGHNVLADAGSYRYNAADLWHEHFMRTSSHNTVTVDGLDQMLHYRRFKVLYWTKAKMLEFIDEADWVVATGEHYGFGRKLAGCVHRRSVCYVKEGLWVVVDTILGRGAHDARLHWLGGDFPWTSSPDRNGMDLETPAGLFSIRVLDASGAPISGSVCAGLDVSDRGGPRGWLSRYYSEKAPVPSLAVSQERELPVTFISILGHCSTPVVIGNRWELPHEGRVAKFSIQDGGIRDVAIVE